MLNFAINIAIEWCELQIFNETDVWIRRIFAERILFPRKSVKLCLKDFIQEYHEVSLYDLWW